MAELASSVAGLLSLGITMCHGILTYYDAFRGFRDDIDKMCCSMENVYRILLAIDSTVSRGRFDKDMVAVVENSIGRCKQGLDTLVKKLEKIRIIHPDGTLKNRLENAKRRILYPFKESTLVKLREICDDLKDNLGLAIDVLNVDTAITTQQSLDGIVQSSAALSKDVANVAIDVRAIRLEQETTAIADIYAWLTPLTTVFQNKHRESLSTKVRQDDGAQQLLRRPQFKSWMSSTGTTLWCSGLRKVSPDSRWDSLVKKSIAGIGKTINASYIIETLRQLCRDSDIGVAYIYFSYKDTEIQTPVNIIASVLQQLISERPDHFLHVKDLYAQHVKQNTRPSVGDIISLLQRTVFSFSKVFIIVDALDECSDADDVRSILLTELMKLQLRMCLLVMSRPSPELEKLLEGAVHVTVEASPADIRNYLQQRLESTSSMQNHLADDPTLRDTIVSLILQKVKGMFLMARLYLDTLMNKTTRRKIKTALETLPEALDSIYEELMIRVKLQNPKDHADLAIRLLGWIFYATRPLTVTEVQHALAIEQGDADLDEDGIPNRDLLVSVCAGMVMINDNGDTINLVHYTTQDYLQRSGKRLLANANRDIASTCLTYLHFDSLSYPIASLTRQSFVPTLLRDHPLLGYAAQHWGNHLREASDKETNEQAIKLLEDDDKVHIIAWVKDYTDNLAKGTYFRPRTQVLGLALASSFGLTTIVFNLIQLGSSVHEKDSNGQTALHRATENQHTDTAALLLKVGAEVNSRDLAGWSPLHQASAKADEKTAKLLIEQGADVDVVDGYHATPLYRAAEAGAERIIRLLLNKRANVLIGNSYHQTALHRAADNGYLSVVQMLLKYGADSKAKDHYGYTPFYRAADQGHDDVAKLLRTHISEGSK